MEERKLINSPVRFKDLSRGRHCMTIKAINNPDIGACEFLVGLENVNVAWCKAEALEPVIVGDVIAKKNDTEGIRFKFVNAQENGLICEHGSNLIFIKYSETVFIRSMEECGDCSLITLCGKPPLGTFFYHRGSKKVLKRLIVKALVENEGRIVCLNEMDQICSRKPSDVYFVKTNKQEQLILTHDQEKWFARIRCLEESGETQMKAILAIFNLLDLMGCDTIETDILIKAEI